MPNFLTALPVYNEVNYVNDVLNEVLRYSDDVFVVDDVINFVIDGQCGKDSGARLNEKCATSKSVSEAERTTSITLRAYALDVQKTTTFPNCTTDRHTPR